MADGLNHFNLIIETNEKIKQLRLISTRIRMRALNALIASLRTGRSAAGFSVVSERIIEFSSRLEKISEQVETLNRYLMLESSRRTRQQRINLIVGRMFSRVKARKSAENLDNFLNRINKNAEAADMNLEKEINAKVIDLMGRFRETRKQSREARVAAVQAKLESVHADRNSVMLTQVADGFTRAIEQLEDLIESLENLWQRQNEKN